MTRKTPQTMDDDARLTLEQRVKHDIISLTHWRLDHMVLKFLGLIVPGDSVSYFKPKPIEATPLSLLLTRVLERSYQACLNKELPLSEDQVELRVGEDMGLTWYYVKLCHFIRWFRELDPAAPENEALPSVSLCDSDLLEMAAHWRTPEYTKWFSVRSSWTLEEATSLIMGREPSSVEKLRSFEERLHEMIKSATLHELTPIDTKDHARFLQKDILEWCKKRGISVPIRLLEAFEEGRKVISGKTRCSMKETSNRKHVTQETSTFPIKSWEDLVIRLNINGNLVCEYNGRTHPSTAHLMGFNKGKNSLKCLKCWSYFLKFAEHGGELARPKDRNESDKVRHQVDAMSNILRKYFSVDELPYTKTTLTPEDVKRKPNHMYDQYGNKTVPVVQKIGAETPCWKLRFKLTLEKSKMSF